ncbi:hypothetical protein [Streptomyces sp. bgisy034]|uniref:hypothetical protein n=1 Tax=Streptomyces sp. bgisy034 TaxID=3413774 RepID=UPI003EBD8E93
MARRPAASAPAAEGRSGVLTIVAALAVALAAQALPALRLVSAQQLPVPRNTPFGVTGPPGPERLPRTADVHPDQDGS